MTDEELDQLLFTFGGPPPINKLVEHVRTLRQRNENLSQAYRMLDNAAERTIEDLQRIRELLQSHTEGKITAEQVVSGVSYWLAE